LNFEIRQRALDDCNVPLAERAQQDMVVEQWRIGRAQCRNG
jgi:hypothetical protein